MKIASIQAKKKKKQNSRDGDGECCECGKVFSFLIMAKGQFAAEWCDCKIVWVNRVNYLVEGIMRMIFFSPLLSLLLCLVFKDSQSPRWNCVYHHGARYLKRKFSVGQMDICTNHTNTRAYCILAQTFKHTLALSIRKMYTFLSKLKPAQ